MKKVVWLITLLQLAVFHLPAQSDERIVVVISPELPNVDALITEMHPDSKIVFFNQAEDPFELITRALQSNEPVSALHILTESEPGAMVFNGLAYPLDSLVNKEELLGTWSQYFVNHGDILLYGCELAKGDDGMAFVQNLAMLTGLDVAGSKDMTGSLAANGDWNLEVRSGLIDAKLVVSRYVDQTYNTVLRGEALNTSKKRKRSSSQARSAIVSSISTRRDLP